MQMRLDYRGCVIEITERETFEGGTKVTVFKWQAERFKKEIASGIHPEKGGAYEDACFACDSLLDDPYRFDINFIGFGEEESGDVITKDGEYIGTWSIDQDDHPSFTPDGADGPLFYDIFLGQLAQKVSAWHSGN